MQADGPATVRDGAAPHPYPMSELRIQSARDSLELQRSVRSAPARRAHGTSPGSHLPAATPSGRTEVFAPAGSAPASSALPVAPRLKPGALGSLRATLLEWILRQTIPNESVPEEVPSQDRR